MRKTIQDLKTELSKEIEILKGIWDEMKMEFKKVISSITQLENPKGSSKTEKVKNRTTRARDIKKILRPARTVGHHGKIKCLN